jgi:DHA2 family multidrug resistance protein
MFMAVLDIQIVSTSLVEIQNSLDLQSSSLSWIQTSYLIAEVLAIALTGIATRIFGIRNLFLFSIIGFTAASFGCGMSQGFASLIVFRTFQGFAGGMLIPLVFTSVFTFFEGDEQSVPTTLAGVIAVLAPTLGPLIGGVITTHYGWQWLFFINIPFGIVAAITATMLLPSVPFQRDLMKSWDRTGFVLLAIGLITLEIGLKEAPLQGWSSPLPLALLFTSALSLAITLRNMLQSNAPIFQIKSLNAPSFIIGCFLSFCLGISLYGAVYLMPMFLGFVRGHDAIEIGYITLVTGAAQLIMAPIAVALERRSSANLLSFTGFAILLAGLGLSTTQTLNTDFDDMFWPQIIRGIGFMLCLIAPTRIALDKVAPHLVSDASALFNLLRNLGGAIGLALIDTILFGRGPVIANALVTRLKAGDDTAAIEIGIPVSVYRSGLQLGITPNLEVLLNRAVEKFAFTSAVNEAWMFLTLCAGLGLAGSFLAWAQCRLKL